MCYTFHRDRIQLLIEERMQKQTCPLCGGRVIKEENFCRSCQNNAKKSELGKVVKEKSTTRVKQEIVSEVILETEGQIAGASKPKKSIAEKRITIIGIIIVGCIIGVVAAHLYMTRKHKLEEMYWTNCIDKNTSLDYASYLNLYPDGKFSITAEARLRELKDIELSEWHSIKRTNDIGTLEAYIIEYPNTPYLNDAENRIDKLGWENALKENTADSYRSYIDNSNLGNYLGGFREIANERYEYYSQLIILEGEEKNNTIKQLDNIFKSLVEKDLEALSSYLDTAPKIFLHIQNLDKNTLIDSIRRSYNNDNMARELNILKERTSITKDIYNMYSVNTAVTEKKTTKQKQITRDTLYFKLQLNDSLKVVRLEKRKKHRTKR